MRQFCKFATLVVALFASHVEAVTFDFAWTGDPAIDPNITSSPDATLSATGVFQINAGPGDAVTVADVLSASITVTGVSISDYMTSQLDFFSGQISGDGSTLFVQSLFFGELSDQFFGCENADCSVTSTIFVRDGLINPRLNVTYTSQAAALASLDLTASVPLPASLPLMFLGLAGIALLRRVPRT